MEPLIQPFSTDEQKPIELTEEQLGSLAFIINSEAYRLFYLPFLAAMLRGFYMDLADPSQDRKNQKPDDYLRGGIMVINALLTFPAQALEEERANREKKNEEKSEVQHYQERADSGSIGPMGFAQDEDY